MNGQIKDEDTPDVCKNHSARPDKEVYRVCTSKLSKKELEDLYFTLLENNLELKKINNSQQDKIRFLSTKLQRMTATQKYTAAKEPKDCCANTKAMVNEQKGSIAELKRANERMSERIRVLNMRLCSAKQFLRRSPAGSTSRCSKCCAPNAKNSSLSVINSKRSDVNFRTSMSSQCLEKDFHTSTKSVATATEDIQRGNDQKSCDENKCQTLIEELKLKIVDLQEELSRTHADYSARIEQLERELCEMQNDKQRIRGEHVATQHMLQQQEQRAQALALQLTEAQGKQGELETQLTIEKQKVLEFEANARAADMSRLVAATIERHVSNTNLIKNDEANTQLVAVSSPYFTPRWESSPSRLDVPSRCRGHDESTDKSEQKVSDDSGYTDANNSQRRHKHEELNQLNKELTERISVLQQQMEELRDTTTLNIAEIPKQENNNGNTVIDKANFDDVVSNTYSISKVPSKKTLDGYAQDQEIANDKKKHFAQAKTMHDVDSNLDDESPRKNLSLKSDAHNSLQIPGPLPVDTTKKTASIKKERAVASKTKQVAENKRKKSITSELNELKNKEDHTDKTSDEFTSSAKTNMNESPKGNARKSETSSAALTGPNETDVKNNVINDDLKFFSEMGVQTASRSNQADKKPQMCNVAVETDSVRDKGQEFGLSTQTYAVVDRCSVVPNKERAAVVAPTNVPAVTPSQKSRGTSPDNTDAEISSLTDLPSEKEGKSSCTPLSPGENKATTTYTDSSTDPYNDYASLSEGELPEPIKGIDKKVSTGETKVNFAKADPVSQRMEEALNAVGVELARCRDLLRSQRSQQQRENSRDASVMTDTNPGAPLRRKPATPCIRDTFAPNCIFTLHIGTVVLSDEAVINSRNIFLVLAWQFFDHDVTMVRMRTGRVVLFDFSTEYDVKITKEFLNYLKYEELRLYICELDKQSEPLATCSLPLRDALLHTNRRADMSLALMAGPKLKRARAGRDSLDTSDEVGVLDLWCELRLHPALLPSLNHIIAKTSTPSASTTKANEMLGSNGVDQMLDENNSADCWLAQSITSNPSPYNLDKLRLPDNQSIASQTKKDMKKELLFSQNKDLRERSQLSSNSKEQELKQSSQHTQSTNHTIIMNEVPVNIKSSMDMKQALQNNIDEDLIPTSSKQHRNTENGFLQTHFAGTPWRGLMARKLIPKRVRNGSKLTAVTTESQAICSNSEKSDDDNRLPKVYDSPPNTLQLTPRSSNDIEEPPELTKTLGGNYRMLDSSKKSVTIAKNFNDNMQGQQMRLSDDFTHRESIQVTVLWLALNEECDAMINPNIQRLYVGYDFLGFSGSELETPQSLPKPKSYADKCSFNFSKTFHLNNCDLPLLGHMAKCRSADKSHDTKNCIVFNVISEPIEDPLGIETCQDIGSAYLYLGDLLAYSGGNNSYTEVLPVRSARTDEAVCGVLAIKFDGLDVVRRCMRLTMTESMHRISRKFN